MDAYSEIDAVYFSIGDKTSYAKYIPKLIDDKLPRLKKDSDRAERTCRQMEDLGFQRKSNVQHEIKTGSYKGTPPYKAVKHPLPKLLKQYHTAEHQVYNCFLNKARTLAAEAQLNEFKDYIPEIAEAKKANPFSIMCGTTIGFSSGILLIAVSIPHIFKLNANACFMLPWLAFIIILTFIVSYYIQKQFYLAKADDRHLILAIEALKEVLKDERDHIK